MRIPASPGEVLRRRVRKGRKEYLVRLEGSPPREEWMLQAEALKYANKMAQKKQWKDAEDTSALFDYQSVYEILGRTDSPGLLTASRVREGRMEYLMKFKDPEGSSSRKFWMLKDVVMSRAKQVCLEEEKKQKEAKMKKEEEELKSYPTTGTSFDKGAKVEEILGATATSGELKLMVRFKNIEDAELIPASVVNIRAPQKVIKFYESKISFQGVDDCEDDDDDE